MATLTITRALAELKLLDKRIRSSIDDLSLTKVGVEKLVSQSVVKQRDEFLAQAKASYDSVCALIKRRNAIKAAIVISNATTTVTIAGQEMTVAEAIERKTSIQYESLLLNEMRSELRRGRGTLEMEQEKYQQRLDNFITSQSQALGKSKTDANWVEELTTSYAKMHAPILLDPIGLDRAVPQLANSINEFESEVDFTLSESNARTTITIPD